jgi:hypothetical protein
MKSVNNSAEVINNRSLIILYIVIVIRKKIRKIISGSMLSTFLSTF